MTPSRRIEVLYVEDSAGDVLLTNQILAEFLQPVKLHIALEVLKTRDALQADPQHYGLEFENDKMRVLRLTLEVIGNRAHARR